MPAPGRFSTTTGLPITLASGSAITRATRSNQPPGGGFDLVARVIAEPLARVMGNPVVVENRPGAGMLLGTEAAAKAEADGYTILLGAKPNIAFNAGLYDKLPYDPRADFIPVRIASFNP